MNKQNTKFSKKPISDWKHGDEYEHYVTNLSLGDIISLEREYFTIEMTQAFDELYYSLLDMRSLRKKWVRENKEEKKEM